MKTTPRLLLLCLSLFLAPVAAPAGDVGIGLPPHADPFCVPDGGEVGAFPQVPDPSVYVPFETGAFADTDATLRETVDVAGAPVHVRLAAPPGTLADVVVRRISGAFPLVVALMDSEGVPLPIDTQRVKRGRIVLSGVAVGPWGGLDVVLDATDGGSGTYEVVARLRPDSPFRIGVAVQGPVATSQVVVPAWSGIDVDDLVAWSGFTLVAEFDDFVVLDTGAERAGYELADARRLENYLPFTCGIEADAVARLPEGSQANGIVVGSVFGRSYQRQVALRSIRAPLAHRGHRGQGTVVAVLDTGIDATHPVFEGRLLPGHDFIDADDVPDEEEDGVDDDGDGRIDEGFGHGTMVAGVVLAAAPETLLLPVRVLDSEGRGTASSVAAGIDFAVAEGADVVNLSLGTPHFSYTLAAAIHRASSAGVLVVTAAGNRGDRGSVDFPGRELGVVSVTALGLGGRRARFGNGNRRSTIAAPGKFVIGPFPGATWARGNGTSFSAALVSGGAALLVERHAGRTTAEHRSMLAARWRLNLRRLTR